MSSSRDRFAAGNGNVPPLVGNLPPGATAPLGAGPGSFAARRMLQQMNSENSGVHASAAHGKLPLAARPQLGASLVTRPPAHAPHAQQPQQQQQPAQRSVAAAAAAAVAVPSAASTQHVEPSETGATATARAESRRLLGSLMEAQDDVMMDAVQRLVLTSMDALIVLATFVSTANAADPTDAYRSKRAVQVLTHASLQPIVHENLALILRELATCIHPQSRTNANDFCEFVRTCFQRAPQDVLDAFKECQLFHRLLDFVAIPPIGDLLQMLLACRQVPTPVRLELASYLMQFRFFDRMADALTTLRATERKTHALARLCVYISNTAMSEEYGMLLLRVMGETSGMMERLIRFACESDEQTYPVHQRKMCSEVCRAILFCTSRDVRTDIFDGLWRIYTPSLVLCAERGAPSASAPMRDHMLNSVSMLCDCIGREFDLIANGAAGRGVLLLNLVTILTEIARFHNEFVLTHVPESLWIKLTNMFVERPNNSCFAAQYMRLAVIAFATKHDGAIRTLVRSARIVTHVLRILRTTPAQSNHGHALNIANAIQLAVLSRHPNTTWLARFLHDHTMWRSDVAKFREETARQLCGAKVQGQVLDGSVSLGSHYASVLGFVDSPRSPVCSPSAGRKRAKQLKKKQRERERKEHERKVRAKARLNFGGAAAGASAAKQLRKRAHNGSGVDAVCESGSDTESSSSGGEYDDSGTETDDSESELVADTVRKCVEVLATPKRDEARSKLSPSWQSLAMALSPSRACGLAEADEPSLPPKAAAAAEKAEHEHCHGAGAGASMSTPGSGAGGTSGAAGASAGSPFGLGAMSPGASLLDSNLDDLLVDIGNQRSPLLHSPDNAHAQPHAGSAAAAAASAASDGADAMDTDSVL